MGSGKLLDSQESGPSADRDITPKARVMSLTRRRAMGRKKQHMTDVKYPLQCKTL